MEIIVHIIQDLNRTLDLGLYVLMDGQRICLASLSKGLILLELPATSTLEFYQALIELRRKISSWELRSSNNQVNMRNNIAGQIYMAYKFDINKHFKIPKYGQH